MPISIGGFSIGKGVSPKNRDRENPKLPLCLCNKGGVPVPGVSIGFWEPVRLVDVTRTPYCMVNLGGVQLMEHGVKGRGGVENGHHAGDTSRVRKSFYHVHWYVYPLLYWLEVLTDFVCMEKGNFDVAYITELDPLWNDDETAFILNPEAVLFGNPIAQAACAADCLAASTGFSQNALFWCGGCQGSMYPFTGTVSHHVGGVQASLLLVQRMTARLHRMGMMWGTIGKAGFCDKYPMPIIQKTQYKTQMLYPVPSTRAKQCYPYSRSDVLWASGKEFPYAGEDFGYLIWRKRNCCAL